MSVETAADRAGFTATDEFGESVTWTVSGGSPVPVPVVIEEGERSDGGYGETPLQIGAAQLTLAAEDLPSGAAVGDSVVKGSETFTVRAIYPDGTGMVEVELEKVTS